MVYLLDGQPLPGNLSLPRRAFGWLTPDHDFRRASSSELTRVGLERAASLPVDLTRGFARCPLGPECAAAAGSGPMVWPTAIGRILLGNGSLEVTTRAGETWVAPTLVVHYVRDHDYRPPDVVIEALETLGGVGPFAVRIRRVADRRSLLGGRPQFEVEYVDRAGRLRRATTPSPQGLLIAETGVGETSEVADCLAEADTCRSDSAGPWLPLAWSETVAVGETET